MAVISRESTADITKETPGSTTDVGARLKRILGYDVLEIDTKDVYKRAVDRLNAPGESIPADKALGDLSEE